uniref:MRG domain-containing protein n=1 Tax=Cebus imitator TaxID=2715852 RepID=A0A2K5RZW8_CEBIM
VAERERGGGGEGGADGPPQGHSSPPSPSSWLTGCPAAPPPAGVNRHFHMICIRDKFSQNIGRQVPSKVIWDHLSTMYDMQALHESEILPFPNSERNFVLPEEIIQEVREVAGRKLRPVWAASVGAVPGLTIPQRRPPPWAFGERQLSPPQEK